MRRFLITAVVFSLIGFVAGNVFFCLVSPLFIDRDVSENLPAELMTSEIARGTFADADSVHQGKGTAQLLATPAGTQIVRFSEFEVTNGPDLKHGWSGRPHPRRRRTSSRASGRRLDL